MQPDPKTVILLGVPFHDVSFEQTLAHIDDLIAARRPSYIATANVDFAAQASGDVELQRILAEAHLVLCDGMPLVWASRLLRAPLRQRVAGSDLFPQLIARATERGHRVFFLGADDATLREARRRLEAAHPGLKIVGLYAPPRANLETLSSDEIVDKVRAANPDLLLVGMGCPKQEKWIYMNLQRLGVPVSIGVGACFDFAAGRFERAPLWMRRTGLEWFARLVQEPKRLGGRYWRDFQFLVRAVRAQRTATKAIPLHRNWRAPDHGLPHEDQRTIVWSGHIDAAAVLAGRIPFPGPVDTVRTVALDLSAVTFIDSTGLGFLLRGFRACKQAGGGLVLLRPSEPVLKLLACQHLDRLLPAAETIGQARVKLGLLQPASSESTTPAQPGELVLRVSGDLTAPRVPGLKRWIEAAWSRHLGSARLVLDLSQTAFMDSSGLGLLLWTRKLIAARPGAQLEIVGANANIRNVIHLAKVDNALPLAAAA